MNSRLNTNTAMILSFTTCFIISTKNNQNKSNFSTRNWKRTNDDVVSEKITKQSDTKIFNKWNLLCEQNIKYFCNLHSQSNVTHDIYDNIFHSTFINILQESFFSTIFTFCIQNQNIFPTSQYFSQADKMLIFRGEKFCSRESFYFQI